MGCKIFVDGQFQSIHMSLCILVNGSLFMDMYRLITVISYEMPSAQDPFYVVKEEIQESVSLLVN